VHDPDGTRSRQCVLDELELDPIADLQRIERAVADVLPVKKHVAAFGANESMALAVLNA
jgi:hypothetical protein